MKTRTIQTGYLKIFAILLILTAMFPSCKKSSDGNANVMLVNGLEGSASEDLYLNGTKVNTQSVAYGQSSGYISTNSGDKLAEFKTSGSTQAYYSSNVTLESGKYYTFYSTATVKTEDDMTAPPSGKCKVRYINLWTQQYTTTNVDFSLNGTNLGSNMAFKTASTFSTIDPGAYTFKIFAAGTTNLYFNMPVTLQAGKIYTMWASNNTALSSHLITHN